MWKMCSVILLCAFLIVCGFTSAVSEVPERNQESEQRIASMEVNQSAGNMTGEDYVIALIYAGINDEIDYKSIYSSDGNFGNLREEASDKFPEYRGVYSNSLLGSEISTMMTMAAMTSSGFFSGQKSMGSSTPVMPEQWRIDLLIYEIFHNDSELRIVYPHTGSSVGLSEDLNEARAAYQTRIAEEAELNAKQEKREADRLLKQQENEARQAALDAYYKAIYENATKELQELENESNNATNTTLKKAKLMDALILINNASESTVSPYSNILAIYSGNILIGVSALDDNHHENVLNIISAIERYNDAKTNFTYSNNSKDYQNAVYHDFIDEWKWNGIDTVKFKTGIAEDKLEEELNAMLTDLRDAPNAKQLLSGHITKKYEVTVFNYTEPILIRSFEASNHLRSTQPGYCIRVNLSAYNDPVNGDIDDYVAQSIPTCIDIFSSLFRDDKIIWVEVQLNESYYDRFGHTKERSAMIARLDNVTATEIGDWTAFKKYVGKDMDRFEQAVDAYVRVE